MSDQSQTGTPNPGATSETPTIRTFQFDSGGVGALRNSVNTFRGDVNFPIQLLSLQGRPGLDVTLAAIYEGNVEQAVSSWNVDAPTGILGLGWSLPYEQIVATDDGSGSLASPGFYLMGASATRLVALYSNPDGSVSYQAQSYQFWRILYYPGDERWEITREDGVTSVYGGGVAAAPQGNGDGDSIQWSVRWDNWPGTSASASGQSRIVRAWNRSYLRNPAGDQVAFTYAVVLQAVGQRGLSYTKASYLARIDDSFGRTVTLVYGDKIYQPNVICEYQDPHKALSSNTPDAYQSRYETLFLDHIEVRSEGGQALTGARFEYDLFNASGGAPAERSLFYKRMLRSIRVENAAHESPPGIELTYQQATDPRPGMLASVTYPEGGSVAYSYFAQAMPFSREVTVTNPFPGSGVPRVWFGPGYVVVTWYDATGGRLQVSIYSWAGQWVDYNATGIISDRFDLASLAVVPLGDGSFALTYQSSLSVQQMLYLYRRDPTAFGNWTNQVRSFPFRASPAPTALAAGDDFVILYNAGFSGGAFQGASYSFQTTQWVSPALPSVPLAANQLVSLASAPGFYAALSYDGGSGVGSFQLLSRATNGQWSSSSVWSSSFTVAPGQPGVFPLTLAAADTFLAATYVTATSASTVSYEIRVFEWSSRFQVLNPSNPLVRSYTTPVSGGVPVLPVLATQIVGAFAADGPNLLRFVGGDPTSGWVPFSMEPNPDASATYRFAAGDDAAVMTKTVGGNTTATLTTFDPNQPTTAGYSTRMPTEPGTYPTVSGNYLTLDGNVYYRDTAGDWNLLATSLGTNVNPGSVQNRGPSYMAWEIGSGGSTQTCVALLRNGALGTPQTLAAPQRVWTGGAAAPGTQMAGPDSFVTYPSGQSFDAASSISLYRVFDGAVVGAPVDWPVSYLSIDDGYRQDTPYYQEYTYDLSTAIVGVGTGVTQYAKITVTSGTHDGGVSHPYGSTQYFYSNGFSQVAGSFYPVGWVFNYDLLLNGMQLATRSFDAGNRLVSEEVAFWRVFTTTPGSSTSLYGGYARQVKSTSSLDGVAQVVETAYDPLSGLALSTTTSSLRGNAAPQVYVQSTTYATSVPAYRGAMNAKHVLSAMAQSVSTTNGVVTASKVITYQNWDATAASWQWAPLATYQFLGTTASPTFDFTPGASNPAWQQTSEVLARLQPSGVVTAQSDISGLVSSYVYDSEARFPVAVFENANAAAGEAGYLGFESYETAAGWSLGTGTQVVDGDAHSGVRSLRLPPGATGPAATFQQMGGASVVLGFWVKTDPGFGADPGTARWSVQISQGGSPVGAPIVVPISDSAGRWQYQMKVVSLASLVGAVSLAVSSVNQKQSTSLLLDDVLFVPVPGDLRAQAYDADTWTVTAVMDPNGGTRRYVYDGFQRQIADTTAGGATRALNVSYLSRGGHQGSFSGADPNRTISIQARAGGFYDDFARSPDWQSQWTANVPADYQIQAGTLVHSGTAAGTLTALGLPAGPVGLCARVTPTGVPARPLGVSLGALSVQWNPATCLWELLPGDGSAGATLDTPAFPLATKFASTLDGGTVTPELVEAFGQNGYCLSTAASVDVLAAGARWTLDDASLGLVYWVVGGATALSVYRLPRQWLFVGGTATVLFFADGQPIFSFVPAVPASGALSLFAADTVGYSDVVAFAAPVIRATLADGAGRQTQALALEGAVTLVQQEVYDPLGRDAVSTKPARLPADAGHPPMAYRDDFVTAMDWDTGVMQGAVAAAYPADQGYPYDRQVFEASPLGRVVEKGAAGKDFAVDFAQPSRHTISYGYSASDGSFGFPAGQYYLRSVVDQQGVPSSQIADKTGVVMGKTVDVGTTNQPHYLQTWNGYDPAGNLALIHVPNAYQPPTGTASDWNIGFGRDFLGQLITQTLVDSGTSQFVLDPAGRTRFAQDANGAAGGYILYRKYDVLGRLTETGSYPFVWDRATLQAHADTDPGWPQGAAAQKLLVYDGDGTSAATLGRLWKSTTSNLASGVQVVEDLVYDVGGAVIERGTTLSSGGGRQAFGYHYDTLGNTVRIDYPAIVGLGVTAVTYTYDSLARLFQIGTPGSPAAFAQYTYEPSGAVATEALGGPGSPVARSVQYLSPGWPTQIATTLAGNGTFVEDLDYTSGGYQGSAYYNGAIAETSFSYAWQGATAAPSDYAYQYGYDPLGRLTAAQWTPAGGPDFGVSSPVTYDANSNFLTASTGSTAARYVYAPATNQVTSMVAGGVDAFVLAYDLNGNARSVVTPEQTLAFTYDAVTQMTATIGVTPAGGGAADALTFTYGGKQQRLIKSAVSGGVTTTTTYLFGTNPFPLVELRASGGGAVTPTAYVYGTSGIVAFLPGPATYYPLKDHLGSTRVVVDGSGTVVAGWDYLPFGGLARAYGQTGLFTYLYTGQELDPETGVYNFQARLYDPGLGRFYAPDPAQQFYSPYVYAADNPLTLVDPNGQMAWWEWLLLGVTTAVGIVATVVTFGAAAPAVAGADAAIVGTELAAVGAEAVATGVEVAATGTEAALGASEVALGATEAAVDAGTVADVGSTATEAASEGLSSAASGVGEGSAESVSVAAGEEAVDTGVSTSSSSLARYYSPREWLNVWGDQGGVTNFTRRPFNGRLSFLNRLGLTGYDAAVTNYDAPGTFGFLDTQAHEGFHAFIARNLPFITQAGNATIGRVPIGAPVIYLEEVVAYSVGHLAAGRIPMVLLAPLEAFFSLPPGGTAVTLVTFAVVGGGVAAGTLA